MTAFLRRPVQIPMYFFLCLLLCWVLATIGSLLRWFT